MIERSFFENAVIGLCRLDREGNLLDANPALLDLLRSDSLESLRAHPDIPTSAEDRRQFVDRVRLLGRLSGFETLWRTADGQVVRVRINAARRNDPAGVFDGIDASVEDVTDREQKDEVVRDALRDAERRLEMQASFLSSLSHEVRTPLTAIIGFSSILGRELSGESVRHARLIEESGRRLVDTMDAVLTFTNLETQQRELQIDEVDLTQLVREITDGFRARASNKGIGLKLNLEADAAIVATDVEAVEIALRCLISNAIKSTDEGDVTVSLQHDDQSAVITITDSGQGIDPELVPYFFESSRSEPGGTSRPHVGLGIGVTVAHRIAQFLGARLGVESAPSGGSSFQLVLPMSSPESVDLAGGTVAQAQG